MSSKENEQYSKRKSQLLKLFTQKYEFFMGKKKHDCLVHMTR